MPIWATRAASWRSARRMSGRRRRSSAGTPMPTVSGGEGMGRFCPSSSVMSCGGIPSSTQRVIRVCRMLASVAGICASVSRTSASACATSSSVAVPAFAPELHDRAALLLDLEVLANDDQLLFQRAQENVVGRHLGDQADQHVIVVGHGGQHRGVGGLDPAAEAAPDIQFPARRKARERVPVVEHVVGDRAPRAGSSRSAWFQEKLPVASCC